MMMFSKYFNFYHFLLQIEGEDTLTAYVVTRWYRSPEILCNSPYYGKVHQLDNVNIYIYIFLIDIWCFFQFVYNRRNVFLSVLLLGC